MKKFSDLLQLIVNDPSIVDETFFKKFYDDISDGIIKRCSKERSSDVNYLRMIERILE